MSKIQIYKEHDFKNLRAAGNLAAKTLDMITPYVKEGISTGELDDLINDYIIKNNAIPATLNYRGYPKSSCISVNHVVCHGIPSYNKILKNKDILNIDVTVILDSWHGDTSRMYAVGEPSIKAKNIIQATYEALFKGIKVVKPGAFFGDIGYAIQNYAEKKRYSVVRDFVGHGIGKKFHEEPNVFHFGKKGTLQEIKKGMVFTIEPMINLGKYHCKILSDGWTAVTKDKSLSSQFEHMIGVTEDGCEIFTKSPKNYNFPPYLNEK